MGTARVTFVIDEKGVIEEIIEKVDTENHADQILKKTTGTQPAKKKPTVTRAVKKTKKTVSKKTASRPAKKAPSKGK